MTTDSDLGSLGQELRRLRESKGITQTQMARAVGLSARSAVADYESGRRLPPDDIIRNYERAFGLDPGMLRERRNQARAAQRLQTIEVCEPEPVPVPAQRDGGRSRRAVVAVTVLLAFFAALNGPAQASSALPGLDPTWTEPDQNDNDRAIINSAPESMDGDDPRARDCYADATVLATTPMYLPDGAVFGTLRLRHSNHCGASWGSAYYKNPDLYTITIILRRPADGAVLHDPWDNNTPPGSYGNMLSTAAGCVSVEAVVTTPKGALSTTPTPCLT